ncbi:MAG: selenium metabolism-associated LysR family transcriptional regulator [Thermodesulfobacteriota bacterium]|nr:selenium metabolism-associated LysR family transcriptional regulator [Thermodesulfobacteriota bacterium]
MDLWRLYIFCKVVELKSFSKAASAVFLSQPTVSSHIKDLEHHFECKLIDRLGREVAPTKAGELLYGYATKMIALRDNAEKVMAEFQGKVRGHLAIGGSTIPGGYILPPLLGKFKEAYPGVTLTLTEGDTSRIVQETLEGSVELGVVGAKTRESRLVQEKIMDDQMFLIVPGDHKWAARGRVTLEELGVEPFVLREPGSGTRKSIEEVLDQSGYWPRQINVVAAVGSTEAIRQAIKAGVGISILSECAVAEELATGTLKKLEIKGLSFKRAFYLIMAKYRSESPLCRAFVTFLKQETEAYRNQ